MRNGLIVFAREPLPGRVKTRLAADIGDTSAADVYSWMLGNVLDNCRKLVGIETIVYWACDSGAVQSLAGRYDCVSTSQVNADLGQRMQVAFSEMFTAGFETCCIIGSDAPDLPVSYILEAFDLLIDRKADVVFGPSHDGGYYLLGLSRPCPSLFIDIEWSTPQVLQQSLAAAERAGLKAIQLPGWYDIDTHDDLIKYWERSGTNPILAGVL